MKFEHWDLYHRQKYHDLIEKMAIEVIKGSPLLNLTSKTSIGLVLSKIAWGVVQASYFPEPLDEHEVSKAVKHE